MSTSHGTTPALSLLGLTRRYGALTAVDDVSLDVVRGGVHAVIGPNGAGKSTLFNLVGGTLPPSSGRVLLHGEDVTGRSGAQRARAGLVKTFQHSSLFLSMSVGENIALSAQRSAGHGMSWWRSSRRPHADVDATVERCLRAVALARREGVPAGALSHGERRQLEVAVALAADPSVLLLDEPVAGMSPAESARFAELVESLPDDLTVLLIEHDLDLVFRLAHHVTVMHLGAVLANGTPAQVREHPEVQRAYMGQEDVEELFGPQYATKEVS